MWLKQLFNAKLSISRLPSFSVQKITVEIAPNMPDTISIKDSRPGGVLNFHFGIGVRPEGRKWGLKERTGTKNRGLKNGFF